MNYSYLCAMKRNISIKIGWYSTVRMNQQKKIYFISKRTLISVVKMIFILEMTIRSTYSQSTAESNEETSQGIYCILFLHFYKIF